MLTDNDLAEAIKQSLYTEKGYMYRSSLVNYMEQNSLGPSRFAEENIKPYPDAIKSRLQDEFARIEQKSSQQEDGKVTAMIRDLVTQFLKNKKSEFTDIKDAVKKADAYMRDVYYDMMEMVKNAIKTNITEEDKSIFNEINKNNEKIQSTIAERSKLLADKTIPEQDKKPRLAKIATDLEALTANGKQLNVKLENSSASKKMTQITDITIALCTDPSFKKLLTKSYSSPDAKKKKLNEAFAEKKFALPLENQFGPKAFEWLKTQMDGIAGKYKNISSSLRYRAFPSEKIDDASKMLSNLEAQLASSTNPADAIKAWVMEAIAYCNDKVEKDNFVNAVNNKQDEYPAFRMVASAIQHFVKDPEFNQLIPENIIISPSIYSIKPDASVLAPGANQQQDNSDNAKLKSANVVTPIQQQLEKAKDIYANLYKYKSLVTNEVENVLKSVELITKQSHINDPGRFSTANAITPKDVGAIEARFQTEYTDLLKKQAAVIENYLIDKFKNQKTDITNPNSTKESEFFQKLFVDKNDHHASRLAASILKSIYTEHPDLFSSNKLYGVITNKDINSQQYDLSIKKPEAEVANNMRMEMR